MSTLYEQNPGSPFIRQDPLRGNGYWFPYVYIKTLYEAMVIYFLMFTLRPSTRQRSLISLGLHQDPLQGNGHGFYLYWGPLRGNGHRFLHTKALCKEVVFDLFPFDIDSLLEISLTCFLKKSEKNMLQPKSRWNDKPKIKFGKNRFWSCHHSLFWKIMEKSKR